MNNKHKFAWGVSIPRQLYFLLKDDRITAREFFTYSIILGEAKHDYRNFRVEDLAVDFHKLAGQCKCSEIELRRMLNKFAMLRMIGSAERDGKTYLVIKLHQFSPSWVLEKRPVVA